MEPAEFRQLRQIQNSTESGSMTERTASDVKGPGTGYGLSMYLFLMRACADEWVRQQGLKPVLFLSTSKSTSGKTFTPPSNPWYERVTASRRALSRSRKS